MALNEIEITLALGELADLLIENEDDLHSGIACPLDPADWTVKYATRQEELDRVRFTLARKPPAEVVDA